MSVVDVVVVVAAFVLSAGLWRFFFGAKDASRAELRDGVQERRGPGDILDERYARGELTTGEFRERLDQLL